MITKLFSKVKSMMESQFDNIDANEAQSLIKTNPNLQILDVRTPQEVREGKIKNSVLADIFSPDFKEKISRLNKEKPVLVYCRSGNRSRSACSLLTRQGFSKVYNLTGGFTAYRSKI